MQQPTLTTNPHPDPNLNLNQAGRCVVPDVWYK